MRASAFRTCSPRATLPRGREAFRRKFTSLKSTSLSLAHPRTGLSLSSRISAAAAYLREDDRLLCTRAMLLRYANIIFDLDRAAALKTVHGYLDDLGIAYCGRYGDWGYLWTDESFKSGELAAERAISMRARPKGAQVPVGC